nr:uncharacterized protein CI109_005100 [Kwoniella shandongensis]KAA5526526.1 hypothetical protein CI109_005100 [Kwoniella shandongensis]
MDLDIAASSSPLSIHAARPLGGIITPALAPASTPGLITNHYTNANANANASAQGYGQPSPNYHYVPNGMMNHHQHIPNGHGPGHGPANGVTPRGRGGGRGSRGGGRGRPPSVQRQVTASSYTNGNVNGSPSSTGSSSDNHLPPNQIHIVQSNPQRITHYPPSATAGLQQQQHLINGYGYGDRFALPNGTTTGPSPYPVVDGPTAARSTLPFGADSSYR